MEPASIAPPAAKLPGLAGQRLLGLLGVAALLPAAGCCPLARWLCGPDTSPWVSIAYDSPRAALRTFLEAARRDDAAVAYRSLSTDYKQRLKQEYGLAGTVEASVAWNRMKQDMPLHMLGYAAFEAPEHRQTDGANWVLDVEGYRFRVWVVRQPYWSVSFTGAGDVPLERSDYVGSLNSYARIQRIEPVVEDEERSVLHLHPIPFTHWGIPVVPLDRLVRAEIGHEWKVDRIEALQQ
jgi:hypothetical protein